MCHRQEEERLECLGEWAVGRKCCSDTETPSGHVTDGQVSSRQRNRSPAQANPRSWGELGSAVVQRLSTGGLERGRGDRPTARLDGGEEANDQGFQGSC